MTACFAQDIAALLEAFSERDTAGKQSLQQMLSSDQATFCGAAIQVLSGATNSAGARYLLHLLRKHNLLMEGLVDPRVRRETAVAAARMIPQFGTPIDADLERLLSTTLADGPSTIKASRVIRLLDVLEAASAQPRFNLYQTELMRYPDSAVRSRAAFLVARSSKNPTLVGRLLMDEDTLVQANAVEALWTFEPAEARPLFLQAARSKTPRVAGNAAVGLYRIGDVASLALLFSMAREGDATRRTTAAWAMGETGDPRFLTFLTAWYPNSTGGERVNILQALGRIRRREKLLQESGDIEIRCWSAHKTKGTGRHLVLSLLSPDKPDLSALKPTRFAVWNGTSLVEDYEISTQPNPALMSTGFILPRFSSTAQPYAKAVLDAMERCLKYKRGDDLWRLDRYLIEPKSGEPVAPLEKAALPYDDAVLGPFIRAHQRGFLSAPEGLRRVMENPGSSQRAADDAVVAFDRQSEAMIKIPGRRKLFLFLPALGDWRMQKHMPRLLEFIQNERITMHGIAPNDSAGCEQFEGLCLASDGGSFSMLPPAEIADEVERIYAQSINRFEVAYRVEEESEPEEGCVQISSESGCGRVSFRLTEA